MIGACHFAKSCKSSGRPRPHRWCGRPAGAGGSPPLAAAVRDCKSSASGEEQDSQRRGARPSCRHKRARRAADRPVRSKPGSASCTRESCKHQRDHDSLDAGVAAPGVEQQRTTPSTPRTGPGATQTVRRGPRTTAVSTSRSWPLRSARVVRRAANATPLPHVLYQHAPSLAFASGLDATRGRAIAEAVQALGAMIKAGVQHSVAGRVPAE